MELIENTQQALWSFLATDLGATDRTAGPYIIRIRVKLHDTQDEMMDIDNEDSISRTVKVRSLSVHLRRINLG